MIEHAKVCNELDALRIAKSHSRAHDMHELAYAHLQQQPAGMMPMHGIMPGMSGMHMGGNGMSDFFAPARHPSPLPARLTPLR